MSPTVVTNQPAADPTIDSPSPAAAPARDPAELARENAELREQVAENQRTAQYWADRARATPPATPVPPEPEPDEDDVDVLEAITTGGTAGFDKLAQKRGFVRKAEVAEMIESRAATLTKEQELLGRYEDLKDKTSEFFKTTASHYGALVKSGTPAQVAMELAAEKAELDFIRAGKIKTPGAQSSKEEREADRLRRVAAQSGEGGGARRPAAAAAEDDELTPEQKRIADGMGISHEQYLKRAKAGVRMGGKSRQ